MRLLLALRWKLDSNTNEENRVDIHSIGIEGSTEEDIVVVVVGNDLLESSSTVGLELLDIGLRSTLLLELLVDTANVGCKSGVLVNRDFPKEKK